MTPTFATNDSVKRLEILHRQYINSACNYLTQSTSLDVKRWKKYFPYFSTTTGTGVQVGEKSITRQQVFDVFAKVSSGHTTRVQALVAVMAWGTDRPYGAFLATTQFRRIASVDSFEETLNSLVDIAEPIDAYNALKEKLSVIRPSLATKYLYFASGSTNRAPIFDVEVRKWLKNFGVRPSHGEWTISYDWNSKLYQNYCDFCTEICELLEIEDRGLVEYLMFIDSRHSDFLEQERLLPQWIKQVSPMVWSEYK